MGSVGAGLVLGEKTMARERGVVGRGLGVRGTSFAIDVFHIFTSLIDQSGERLKQIGASRAPIEFDLVTDLED